LRRIAAVAAAGAFVLAAAAPAPASPYIQAHRGGTVVRGVPTYPESSMAAFRHSARQGFVLEFDVKITSDGVPVVFHDPALDRATDCSGNVVSKTLAELGSCRVDILGTEAQSKPLEPGDPRAARIPTFEELLDLLERTGAHASIEIKNVPTDPDFDPTNAFAQTVVDTITTSDVPRSNLILQSFWPPNLTVAESELPDVETALLTLGAANDGAPAYAAANGIEWISGQYPISDASIQSAHALGRRVVPYTLDSPEDIRAAAESGVDALITNDPATARRIVREVEGARPKIPPPPSRSACMGTKAPTHLPPIVSKAPDRTAPRVFAMQYRQDLANVESYETFRTKIECMVRQYVKPRLARRRPNVVAFNEDVGLMTIATGSRGAQARQVFADPDSAPSCEPQGAPCGALGALGAITAQYGPQASGYGTRFPGSGPVETAFLAPTDTFARGWMQVFSDMARRYGVYMIGSNTQAPFRESRDPTEISLFADPDLPEPDSVYVATEGNAYNSAFVWAPHDVRTEGPLPLRNVVAENRKVPLTELEEQLEISNGPATGPDAIENLEPVHLPGTQARLGIATSLPAFQYGREFGETPAGGDPCADVSVTYMPCLHSLGTNVVIQDEANPGRWAASYAGGWQPLEWMSSSWRHVADPFERFDYNVTPFMVGNLADLVFDGQTSIAQRRKARGHGCNYIGTRRFIADAPESDPERYRQYAGRKREFLGIARWVRRHGARDRLRDTAAQLAAGSGDELENDYVETAVIADLPFPVERSRRACVRR
jgi:glycerophosphoryl diester phosphodiesterase